MRIGLYLVTVVAAFGCGGEAPRPAAAAAPSESASAPAGDLDGDDLTKPVDHPFAKDNAAAMTLMDAAVDKRVRSMSACIDAFRARKHSSLAKFVVKIGVDENGTLIAVTGNDGETDDEANTCLREALKRAPFPKSHAGIIEIVKTYSYEAVDR